MKYRAPDRTWQPLIWTPDEIDRAVVSSSLRSAAAALHASALTMASLPQVPPAICCTAWRTCPSGHGLPAGTGVGAAVVGTAVAPHALQRHTSSLLQATALFAVLKANLLTDNR